MKTAAEKIERLCSLRNHGSKFGIDRMRLLAAAVGNPQNAVPLIHLAGTNGKGSCAAMIESILRAHGLRVGLYTSPHLLKLGERIQVNRELLSDDEICDEVELLYAAAEKLGALGDDDYPSFFEFMTAMAFLRFSQKHCDVAVIETGLGGRLDATNIVAPAVCVITSIGFDHMEMLGNTLVEIAREKAGIIKENIPVVLGFLPEEAETEIRKIARERHAQIFSVREVFGDENSKRLPTTNLFGQHQRANAACALLAAEIFLKSHGRALSPDAAENALKNIVWRARWETIPLNENTSLILDVAHNSDGAAAIDRSLATLCAETKMRPQIVTGILGIERARALIPVFAKYASAIHFVQPSQDRACSFAELKACVPENFLGKVFETSVSALFPRAHSCTLKPETGTPIIVAGSCYLAGEVLAAIAGTVAESEFQDKLSFEKK